MKLNLQDMADSLRKLERADRQNLKRGQDVEMSSNVIILTASDGTRWALEVSTSGVLSTTQITNHPRL